MLSRDYIQANLLYLSFKGKASRPKATLIKDSIGEGRQPSHVNISLTNTCCAITILT